MVTKIFITGATGYIGGDAFYAIASAHTEYEISALVRTTDKGAKLAAAFPKTRLVYGTLDDADLLETEAKAADIVLNCASADHPGAVSAIVSGLSAHKGYLIHTSGTGILTHADKTAGTFGTALSSHVFNDLSGVSEIVSLPDEAPHRPVDKLVLDSHVLGVKPAIVCPPTIYGETRGPAGGPSIQIPDLATATLKTGKGITVNEGKAWWNNVHVHDLGELYLLLVEAAVEKRETVVWGPENYYFVENGEHVWADVAKQVAQEAKRQGLIDTDEIVGLSLEEVERINPHGSLLWGANSRGKAERAKEGLGWAPKGVKLEETVADTVSHEARKMGFTKGHAAKAAGET